MLTAVLNHTSPKLPALGSQIQMSAFLCCGCVARLNLFGMYAGSYYYTYARKQDRRRGPDTRPRESRTTILADVDL